MIADQPPIGPSPRGRVGAENRRMTGGRKHGLALSRAYFDEVVAPILTRRFPDLPYSAGRLGSGSDVLGFDDDVSRDHDWGLRLSLFVAEDAVAEVDRELERLLPDSFQDLPVRFVFTGQPEQRHYIEVASEHEFLISRIGFDPRAKPSAHDWLSVSGQAALEVVAGPIFVEKTGELTSMRRALEWYPDDVWRYVLACDWIRIEQELPLMGRAADVGDDLGSRIIAARLVHTIMHMAFMTERRWPPYAKWFGMSFRGLADVDEVGGALDDVLRATDIAQRQAGVASALDLLLDRQNASLLTATASASATVPFWDRPHLHPNPEIVSQLLGGITDPVVAMLPRGRGSVEQRTDNVDVLVDVAARMAAVAD